MWNSYRVGIIRKTYTIHRKIFNVFPGNRISFINLRLLVLPIMVVLDLIYGLKKEKKKKETS